MKMNIKSRLKPLSLALGLFIPVSLIASPQGGNIVAGSGSITTPDVNTTNVNQQSGSLAIDWQSFNVANGQSVNFNQPSSSAVALNRIFDQNPSNIMGAINANGRVFLSNSNGIIFGESARVNVGALVASGLNISVDDFMNGNYDFNATDGLAGSVINRGILQAASGGSISLIGGHIANEGLVVADYGEINLTTGNQVILNFDGDGLLNLQATQDVLNNIENAESSVHNTGELRADGGQIVLSANTAQNVFDYAVNNEGLIQAKRMVNEGGVIRLMGNEGTTIHSGEIDVSNDNGEGGTVYVLGDKVGLFGEAYVNASGSDGGGEVLIGGDFQGNNSDIQNATQTFISAGSSIKADAIEQGDGGKVIVWADNTTWFYGDISTRGGEQLGDGGFVEVSGKETITFDGNVNTSAPNGNIGMLLLDPLNINITNGSGTAADESEVDPSGNFLFGDVSADTANSTTGTAQISQATLEGLAAGTNIELTARDNITIENITGDNTLDLSTTGSVTFTANADGSGTGDFSMNTGDIIRTQGASVTISAENVTLGSINTTGADNAAGGAVNVTATVGTLSVETITTTGGTDTDGATSGGNAGGAVTLDAATVLTTGVITTAGSAADTGSAANGGAGGTVALTGTTRIDLGGDIDTTGGAGEGAGVQGAGGTVTVNNPAQLLANRAITTGATAGNITFASTIDNSSSSSLSLNAGTGAVTITGATGGGGTALSSLTISAASQVDLGNVTTTGFQSITGSNIDLNGTTYNSNDGTISYTGAVDLIGAGISINSDADNDATDGNITFSSTVDGAQTLSLDSDTGDIVFTGVVGSGAALGAVTINAANNVTLSSAFNSAGFNQSTSGTGTTLIAGLLTSTGAVTLDAVTIDLNDSITTTSGGAAGLVTLNAGSGGVDLAAGQAITTTATAGGGSDSVVSGAVDINVSSTGSVNLAGNIVTTGDDNDSGVGSAGGEVTIDTNDGGISVADITTSGGAGTGAAGGSAAAITLNAADAGGGDTHDITFGTLTALGGTGTSSGSGSALTLTADNNVALGRLITSSTVDVTATNGAITDANAGEGAGNENITGTTVTLVASSGIGVADDIDTAADTLLASTSTGGMQITETDAVLLGGLTTGTSGDITVVAGGEITTSQLIDTAGNGSVNISTSSGDITITDAILADGAGTVDLNAAGLLTVNNSVVSTLGALTLTGGTGATFGVFAILNTDGTIQVNATANDITMADGSEINAQSGEIDLNAADNVALGRLVTTGAVNVEATAGAITDITVSETPMILGSSAVTLVAGTSIGTTGDGDIDTNTANLTVDANGNVFVASTITLTDLSLTLDPGSGINTYNISAGGLSGFNLTDSGSGLEAGCTVCPMNFDITTDTGNIGINPIVATGRTVSLTATDGNIVNVAGSISATDLDLTANGTTGTIGTSLNPVTGDITGELTASANDGGVFFRDDTGDLNITSIDAGTGNVELQSAGFILDDGIDDTTVDITGNALTIVDSLGIGASQANALNLDVNSLNISSTSGDVFITEASDIALGTINAGIANSFNLQDLAGSITSASSNITANDLTLTVANDETIGASGNAINTSIDGVLTADASGGTGGIFISQTGNLEINLVNAGTGNIELASTGRMTDVGADNTVVDIAGNSLTIVNSGGLGTDAADALNLSVNNLSVVNTSGDSFLTEASNIALGSMNFAANNLSLIDLSGSISNNGSFITAGDLILTVDGAGQAIGATGAADDINVNLSGSLTANASNGTGGIFISETGEMNVALINAGTGGNVELAATGRIIDTGTDNTVVDVIATNLTIRNSGGLGTSAADALNISVDNLTVASTSGSSFVTEESAIAIANVNVGSSAFNLAALAGSITDGNGDDVNITAGALTMSAVSGIGSTADAIETSATSLSLSNTSGEINISETDGVSVASATTTDGDITINTPGAINFSANANVTTTTSGGITLNAGESMAGAGDLTISSAESLVLNQALTINGDADISAASFIVQDNISSTGFMTLGLAGAGQTFTFNPEVEMSAGGLLTVNAIVNGNGDIGLTGDGIDIKDALTADGSIELNAGAGTLTVEGVITANGDEEIAITATDLVITDTGAIASDTGVTRITDTGNGINLGGNQAGFLNIDTNEILLITGAGLEIVTPNEVVIDGFLTSASTVPLTIDAGTLSLPAKTEITLAGDLDFADSFVDAASTLDIEVDGTFSMSNLIDAEGDVSIIAGANAGTSQGIIMGDPNNLQTSTAEIRTSNDQVDLTAVSGDVLLGLVDAGTADVNITATAGDILNNNGVFTDINQSQINIVSGNATLNAFDRIGVSSTDAITLFVEPFGLITLDFGAEKAFINDLRSTPINNLGEGEVAVGLIFSSGVIGVGHVSGLNSTNNGAAVNENDPNPVDKEVIALLGEDFVLTTDEEDEEIVSSMITTVPVLVKTKNGWEFKQPSKRNKLERLRQNMNNSVKYIDWL